MRKSQGIAIATLRMDQCPLQRRGRTRLVVVGLVGAAGILSLLIALMVWAKSASPGLAEVHVLDVTLPAPSESNLLALGQNIQQSINERDPGVLNAALDWDTVMARAAGEDALPEGMQKWQLTSPYTPGEWGEQLIESMGRTGTYKLLRVRMVDGRPRLMFRVVTENGNPNYHEYVPVMLADGRIKFVDVYVHNYGELLSETVRRDLLPFLKWEKQGVIFRLLAGKNDYVENVEHLVKIRQFTQEGDARQALEVYAQLPQSLQGDKNLLLHRLALARQVGGRPYQSAVNAVNRYLAGDPCTDLVLLANRINEREFEEVRRSLNRINERVEGDPYLKVIRGNVAMLYDENLFEAKLLYQEVTREEPGMPYAYNALNRIALQERDYAETARLLTILESQLGVPVGDLTEVDSYADFVRSAEYRRWSRNRPAEPIGSVY